MRSKRDRLIVFLPVIISLTLVLGILAGNWITGIRIRSIVTDEVNKQKNDDRHPQQRRDKREQVINNVPGHNCSL